MVGPTCQDTSEARELGAVVSPPSGRSIVKKGHDQRGGTSGNPKVIPYRTRALAKWARDGSF